MYSKDEIEKIKELSEKTSKEALFYLIKELSEMENDIKWSTQKTIMFQAEIIKLTVDNKNNGNLEERIEKLEEKIESGDIVAKVPQTRYQVPEPVAKPKGKTETKQAKPKVLMANITSTEYWPKVVNNLKAKGKITLFTNLMNTKAVEINDLQLGIVGLTSFGKTVIEQPTNKLEIEKAIAQETGKTLQIKIEEPQNIIQKTTSQKFDIPINIIDE